MISINTIAGANLSSNICAAETNRLKNPTMKKFLVLLFVIASIPALANDSTSIKLVEKFNGDFPDAVNVQWHESNGKREVYYTLADIKCHLWFNEAGEVVRTVRYYNAKDLAPFLKAKINQSFEGSKIFGVTETSNAQRVKYLVTLENETSWTIVHVDAMGEVTNTDTLTK